MVKFPKEVNSIINRLENGGFEAYAAGACVREALRGKASHDWNIATNARFESLREIFPEAGVVSGKLGIIEIGYEEAELSVDIVPYRRDGGGFFGEEMFSDKLEDDLSRRVFTVNAIAGNPANGIADPFEGRHDIEKKLIKTAGDPALRFEEDPIRMMRAVRLAAELGFDIHIKTYEAILEKVELLKNIETDRIRTEFEKLIAAEFAGKGLKMLVGADMMPYIIGKAAGGMTKREINNFSGLADNIDKTKRIRERRLGLFYLCFEKRRALEAVGFLNFDSKTVSRVTDAVELTDSMSFLANKFEFKQFVARCGAERYKYLDDLSKALRIVYDLPDTKIFSRHYFMEEIKSKEEPLFVEDLQIDEGDIIGAGIADGDKARAILPMLLDLVHKDPRLNTRRNLLMYAEKYSKNKIGAALRKVTWIK